ncbi:hypothetical protein PGTUg99_025733 [Puccinia graminis f. sp. tritici]|uniref:Uncharacterized protein n=1 Tax=Puccinia graminis f. sp. tritici TaxID=56615 RepID=A0A5B0S8B6_PUCGR|nr:hypothetical protein PGTUg99_025733 [Puccinia graminis f. sp. tritici]
MIVRRVLLDARCTGKAIDWKILLKCLAIIGSCAFFVDSSPAMPQNPGLEIESTITAFPQLQGYKDCRRIGGGSSHQSHQPITSGLGNFKLQKNTETMPTASDDSSPDFRGKEILESEPPIPTIRSSVGVAGGLQDSKSQIHTGDGFGHQAHSPASPPHHQAKEITEDGETISKSDAENFHTRVARIAPKIASVNSLPLNLIDQHLTKAELISRLTRDKKRLEVINEIDTELRASFLIQEEKLKILLIKWKDRIVREFKINRVRLQSGILGECLEREENRPVKYLLTATFSSIKKNLDAKRKWRPLARIVNFFRQRSLTQADRERPRPFPTLSKLRREMEEHSTKFSEEQRNVIYRLSVIEDTNQSYFLRPEVQIIIKNLALDPPHLAAEDQRLIQLLSLHTVAQDITLKYGTRHGYFNFMYAETSTKTKEIALRASDMLSEKTLETAKWATGKLNLDDRLKELGSSENLPRKIGGHGREFLALPTDTQQSKTKILYMKAFATLSMDTERVDPLFTSTNQEEARKELAEWWWNFNPRKSYLNLEEKYQDIIDQYATKYDENMSRIERICGNYDLTTTAIHHLEKEDPQDNMLSYYAISALKKMKENNIKLSIKENNYLYAKGFQGGSGNLLQLSRDEIRKLAIEAVIDEKGNIPDHLKKQAYAISNLEIPKDFESINEIASNELFENFNKDDLTKIKSILVESTQNKKQIDQDETKFVKILKILDQQDGQNKSNMKLLEVLIAIKKKEIQRSIVTLKKGENDLALIQRSSDSLVDIVKKSNIKQGYYFGESSEIIASTKKMEDDKSQRKMVKVN